MEISGSRSTPVFPTVNIGSFTRTPVGTPVFHEHITRVQTPSLAADDTDTSANVQRPLPEDSCENGGNIQEPESFLSDSATHRSTIVGHSGPDEQEVSINSSKSNSLPQRRRLTIRQLLTLVVLVAGNISSSMFYSLLAPFYATEATSKGATLYEVGLVFGVFQLINFLMSPVFGNNMEKIGAKFLFVAGNFVCSVCGIMFGTLEWCPDGAVYVAMCFILRSVEAVGAAAQNTATFAIGAHTFPNHISIIMGILQASSCIGLVCGPPIGGALYGIDGFYLPFVTTGSLFLLFSLGSLCLLPPTSGSEKGQASRQRTASKFCRLMRIPVVPILGAISFVAQATIGFVDVALAKFLTSLDSSISSVKVGLIFLIPALLVVITAPIFGIIADKHKNFGRSFIIFGAISGGVGFLGLGPCPLITFLPETTVKSVIICLVVSALGWGSLVVLYQEFVTAAKNRGFPEGLDTQGVISGVNSAFSSLGALMGPVFGGVIYEQLGFPWASSMMAFFMLFTGVVFIVYVMSEAVCMRVSTTRPQEHNITQEPPDERTRLLEEN